MWLIIKKPRQQDDFRLEVLEYSFEYGNFTGAWHAKAIANSETDHLRHPQHCCDLIKFFAPHLRKPCPVAGVIAPRFFSEGPAAIAVIDIHDADFGIFSVG